jgi:hypothetical protein
MPERRKKLLTARLRTAIEFLTTIQLGTAPSVPSALLASAGELADKAEARPSPVASAPPSFAVNDGAPALGTVLPVRGKEFRHVTSRGNRESVLFRRALLRDGVLDARVIFSRAKQHPSGVFSVIRYDAAKESDLMRDRQGGLLLEGVFAGADVAQWNRWKGKSFNELLHAEYSQCSPERDGTVATAVAGGLVRAGATSGAGAEVPPSDVTQRDGVHPTPEAYNPTELDDPRIDKELQRYTCNGEGYKVSILAFKDERSIKDAINSKFSAAHPWLDWGDGGALTLSKIRSLKHRALQAWLDRGLEISTVAYACVYFERLVFKRLVNKANRRLAMATALLLAYKINEARDANNVKDKDVIALLEATFGVSRKAVVTAEFPVFVHLRFSLAVPHSYASPHFERLLAFKGLTPAELLGPDLFSVYLQVCVCVCVCVCACVRVASLLL